MLKPQDADFLRLVNRSPDRGDGWRSVSKTCWPLVTAFTTPELIEIDEPNMLVRLTDEGQAVVDFSL